MPVLLRAAAWVLLALPIGPSLAAQNRPAPAERAVYLDQSGVIRWRDNDREVTLFGANYVLTTASDYRAAGYVGGDRKRMIDEDMAHFARMGWDALRLTFWGDWEASDSLGNLIANDHLDLLDYLIARARERGIYLLFSPIQLYGSNWPDALQDTTAPGFGRYFGKERMGTDPDARAAQVNYLGQILEHVNPYTKVAIKDEPSILFIELVNEPWHHPEDLQGSVRYIDALTEAVRRTGCRKLVFYNVSQDFAITDAIRKSRAQGVTFGWYPTGLNSNRELEGNYLRGVDVYPDMLRKDLAPLPRIVYEFDSPDLLNATMYPAMARTFRSVGTQFAAMFSYDMLQTASRNLGWQTHYLNLVYTPRKAVSSIIAAEAMRRLPRLRAYGPYPRNNRFGDFRIAPDSNLAELLARDAFIYAGNTSSAPPDPAALRRIVGYGSSPVVGYRGVGVYFLDKVRDGIWRLEVYPDAVPIRDPFEPPSPDKIVTRAIQRAWPMTIALAELGDGFSIQPITAGTSGPGRAVGGRIVVLPGVYVLSADGPVDPEDMPDHVGRIGFAEFHPPPADSVPITAQALLPPVVVAGRDTELRARVVDATAPDSVLLYLRRRAEPAYRGYRMRTDGAYEFSATIPGEDLPEGPHDVVVTPYRGDSAVTFPGGHHQQPNAWNYSGRSPWTFDAVSPLVPLRLFEPGTDAPMMSFSRIGDAGRRGLFHVGQSRLTGAPVFHMALPADSSGRGLPDYTASLVVASRLKARGETLKAAKAVRLRMRGLGVRQVLHVTLMEDDGTSWSRAVTVDSGWTEQALPLESFTAGRGVLLPQGFPGEWNYWVGPAEGRGREGDRPRVEHLERLQFSLRRENADQVPPDSYGVEVEWAVLEFAR